MRTINKSLSVILAFILAASVFPLSFLQANAEDSGALIGISGDANQDGVVDISDATYIQKYIVKIVSFTDDQKILADVNNDGISIADVSIIQKYIVECDVSDTDVGKNVYRKADGETKVYINEDFSNEENFPSGQAPSYADWGLESQKQNKWKTTGDVTVTGAEDSRYVRIAGQNQPAELMLDFSDQPLSGTVEIEAVISLKTRGTGSPCLLEIWDTSDTPNKLLSMNSPNDSTVQINDGAWKSILTNDVTDTFHRYVIRINTEKKTHEMWIDGMFAGSYTIRNAEKFNGEIGSVSIYGEGASKNSGQILLDSIKITEYTKSKLSVPTGVYAESFTDSSVSLKWNSVDGADSYGVYRNGEFCAEVFENSFDDTNLSNDTAYTYTIAARSGDDEFDLSSPVTVTTLYNENSQLIANEDFEEYAVGNFESENWETSKTGSASVKVAAIPNLYDKSLLLDAGRSEKAECTLNFETASPDSKIIIDMDIMVDGEGNKFSCAPYINDSQGRQILKFGFRDGYFSAFNDASNTSKAENIIKYDRNRWYSIRIIYNSAVNYYSIYVDGELFSSVDGSKILVSDSIPASITLRTDNMDGDTKDYINNIRVTAVENSDVAEIKFEKNNYKLYEGESYVPHVFFTDKDGDNVCEAYNTEFSSSNPDAVKIDPVSGEIQALRKGTSEITVKSVYNGKEFEHTALVCVENSSDIPVPQSLCAVTVRNYSLELAWNDMGSDIQKYYIYRSDSEDGEYKYIGASKPEATRADSATRYIDNNVEPDTSYYYKVSSVTSSLSGEKQESALSKAVGVTTAEKSSLPQAKPYTINDNFNQDTVDEAPYGYDTSGNVIVKEIPFPEDKSVRVEGGAKASKEINPVTGVITVETKFKVSGTSNTRSVPSIYNSNGDMIARVRTNGSNVEYLSGSSYVKTDFTIKKDVWYIVRVVVNTESKTYDIYIDGQKRVSKIALSNSSKVADVAKIEYASTLNALYFDNVKLYTQSDYIGEPEGEVLNVKDFGALGDGVSNDRNAIQKAIDMCPDGGTVLLEDGVFYTGSIVLKSNMTLYINYDAELLGSSDISDYPYYDPMTYNTQLGPQKNCSRALIYAENAENLKIDGGGTINGNGKNNFTENIKGVSNEPHRPIAIYIAMSNTVTIQNLYVKDSGMWTIVPAESDYVTIRNIWEDVRANANRDGIDITDCKNVLIEDCTLTSADDTICVKSGKRRGVDGLLVQNCSVTVSWTNGIKLGTASYGAFRNCDFRDVMIKNVKYSPMCVESVDGADIENINFSRIEFTDVANPFWIILGQRSLRGTGDDSGKIGSVENISFKDIKGQDLHTRIDNSYDADGSPISGTTVVGEDGNTYEYRLKNISFENVDIVYYGGHTGKIPATPDEYKLGQYPESSIWKLLPAYGYFVRHADNVTFKNCTTQVQYSDIREPLVCVDADVKQLYTVEFESLGGSSVGEQTVESGKTVQKPDDPTKSGYRFDGWYTSSDYSKAWNFETDKINSKTVLYAKWSSI